MSILTKPAVQKGVAATFSISKTELLAHPLVSADSYFSDSGNWYRINVVYKSLVGSQYEIVEFDASPAVPTGTFLISSKARDQFLVQKVQISDFDGGFLEISRANLTASEWDVDLSTTPATFLRDFSNPSSILAYESMTGVYLGNTIQNNHLNLYVPSDAYNDSLYYAAFNSFSLEAGKVYKLKITLQEAPSSNSILSATWNSGSNMFQRALTTEEITQGYVELLGVTSATSNFNIKCLSTDSNSASIKISKYEFIQV